MISYADAPDPFRCAFRSRECVSSSPDPASTMNVTKQTDLGFLLLDNKLLHQFLLRCEMKNKNTT